jgi:hypothetical protein
VALRIKTSADFARSICVAIVRVVFIPPCVEDPLDCAESTFGGMYQEGWAVVSNPNIVGYDGMDRHVGDRFKGFSSERKRLAWTTQNVYVFDFGKRSDDLLGHGWDAVESPGPSRFVMGPGYPSRFVAFPFSDPSETEFGG